MDDRRIPWLVSACVLAILPSAFLFIDWRRVLSAIVIQAVIMFWFSFLASKRNG